MGRSWTRTDYVLVESDDGKNKSKSESWLWVLCFVSFSHKMNLMVGIIPSLNVAAGLLGFFFVKSWSVAPFSKQENTVIQTRVVACYGLVFSGNLSFSFVCHWPFNLAVFLCFSDCHCKRFYVGLTILYVCHPFLKPCTLLVLLFLESFTFDSPLGKKFTIESWDTMV